MPDDDAVVALIRELTAYLQQNPLACDTQEGIARWWFAPGEVVDDRELSRALQRMQQQGLIEPLRAADGRVRYRRIAPPADRDGGTQME